MASSSAVQILDEELRIELPDAWQVLHIDDTKAPWAVNWQGSKVDWAWEEKTGFYLCELKDPECSGAQAHPTPSGQPTHVQATISKLIGSGFPNEFARNASDSIKSHPVLRQASNIRYIVVCAISDPNFVSAVADPASMLIKSHLKNLGFDIPVLVVNIRSWNKHLAPRRIRRHKRTN